MDKWYPKKGRVIFHIDMNCFYAAVEMADNPQLKGKPVAIAGNPQQRKGIIVTSSYEARDKGIQTTMPLWKAKRLCPELIVLHPNFDRYRKASQKMFKILADLTSSIEPVSIDEGYIDITESKHLGNPIHVVKNLQERILSELDLPCSIGIGPNKFLAKTASDMKKPLGITILRKRDLSHELWPFNVERMHGVGEKTAERLKTIEIKTIGDLAHGDVYQLTQLLGINGERLKDRANGNDPRVVNPNAINEFKSIGSSQTLPHDTVDELNIKALIQELAGNIERRLKRRKVAGLTVQLMIRYHDRKTITRSKKMQLYIDQKSDIFDVAYELFEQHWNQSPIRLIGVTLQDIEEIQHIAQQLDLFTYEKEVDKKAINTVVNQLTEKYGKDTFKRLKKPKEKKEPFHTSFQKDFLNDYKN